MKKKKRNLPTSGTNLGGGGTLESKKPKGYQKKILITLSAICIMGLIIGIAYAYIAYYARQSEVNVLGTDCMKIEFKEKTNAISLTKAIPISDEEGYNTRPYIFEITNTCGVGMNYNVNLEVLTIKEGIELTNLIESKNIATKIDDLEVKRLTSEIATTPTYDESDYKATESYMVYTGVLNPGETKSHEVRVWLHYSAGNETQNKNFYSKVVIEGIQNEVASLNFSDYIINERQKDTSIVQVVHEATEQTGLNASIDYRYTGPNPHNYVCFGREESPCPSDNLYRIIGVIPTQSTEEGPYENRVKLVKENYYIGSTAVKNSEGAVGGPEGYGYSWGLTNDNQWINGSLNKILNEEYYNKLGEYQKYIEQAKWYLGAPNGNEIKEYTAEKYYQKERSNTKGYSNGAISYIGNIGLLYPSDFKYVMEKNNTIKEQWLYNLKEDTTSEWLITADADPTKVNETDYRPRVFAIFSWGVSNRGIGSDLRAGIRPTFYLKKDVLYSSGDGSLSNPYRIAL